MSHADSPQTISHAANAPPLSQYVRDLILGHRLVGLPTILAFAIAIWCIGAYTLLGANASYTSFWLNDQFGLVAAGYRMSSGQVPSVDFRSIYGFLTYLPISATLQAGVTPGLAIPAAHALVSFFLLALVALAVYKRLGAITAMLFALSVHTLTIAPVVMGKSPLTAISFGVFYNRHGWAFLAVVFLCFLEPRTKRRRDVAIDSFVFASALAFLAYSIFNFAVIAAGVLIANALTSTYKAKVGILAMGLFATFAAGVELVFPGYHHAYASQLFPPTGLIGHSAPGFNRIAGALLYNGMTEAALCLLAALGYSLVSRKWLVPATYALGSLLGCVVLATQTASGTIGMPGLVGVLVCFAEMTRRFASCRAASAPTSASGNDSIAWPVMTIAIVVVAVAQPITTAALALVDYHQNAGAISAQQESLAPPATLAGFRVGPVQQDALGGVLGYEGERGLDRVRIRRILTAPLPTSVYFESIVDGVQLLVREKVRAQHRLAVFEQVDPFTFALGLRPTCYGIPLFWADRIKDPRRVPTPSEFLADADFVMVPKSPYEQGQLDAMMKYYGEHLESNFAPAGESKRWSLWARKSPAPQDCPFRA